MMPDGLVPLFPKVRREELAMFVIETELCPFVLPRVLAVVREHGAFDLTIDTQSNIRVQQIKIEIAESGKQ